jgi:hypothetical protein
VPELAQRRRGRPLSLPDDPSPITTVLGGVRPRIAWLLAVSRLYAADGLHGHRLQFIDELKARGVSADASRVSRWESGAQAVNAKVIDAYEQVLDIPRGSLATVAEGLSRSLDPDAPPLQLSPADPSELHAALDELFETINASEHDGQHWNALVNKLTRHENVYLAPKTWAEISDLLIAELARSVSLGYIRRYEALRMLIRHPVSQRYAMRSLGVFVTRPSAQVVAQPLTLLQEVPDQAASQLVLRLLSSESSGLKRGSAWVAASKLARHQFDEDALDQLEAFAVYMWRDPDQSGFELDAVDLIARLPRERTERVLAALRHDRRTKGLERSVRSGEIVSYEHSRRVSKTIAARAQAETPTPYRVEPDAMLVRLVREALFHTHKERRNQASLLLGASPFADAVGRACMDVVDLEDEVIAVRALTLMIYVAPKLERDRLMKWSLQDSRPTVRSRAMMVLAQLPDWLDADEEDAVVNTMSTSMEPAIHYGALYLLGMHGARSLARLETDGDDYQRETAHWWRTLGPAIHDPVH